MGQCEGSGLWVIVAVIVAVLVLIEHRRERKALRDAQRDIQNLKQERALNGAQKDIQDLKQEQALRQLLHLGPSGDFGYYSDGHRLAMTIVSHENRQNVNLSICRCAHRAEFVWWIVEARYYILSACVLQAKQLGPS